MPGFLCANPPPFPEGWRLPLASDYFDHGSAVDSDNPLTADLNGDGRDDAVFLLVCDKLSPSTDASSATPKPQRQAGLFIAWSGSDPLQRIDAESNHLGIADYLLVSFDPGHYANRHVDNAASLDLPFGGVALIEVEYGTGQLFWQQNGHWQHTFVSPGEWQAVKP